MILDYDETAVENTIDFYEAYCEALREKGRSCVDFNRFTTLLNENKLHEEIPSEVSETEFWKTFRSFYKSRHSIPRRGLREFLITMRTLNIKVVIVSGRETPSRYIELDLRNHGFHEFIDGVYTLHDLIIIGGMEEFLFDKSALIEYVKRRYSANGTIVCIGDYITDYYSCKKVGGVFIGINSAPGKSKSLREAGVKLLAKDFHDVLLYLYSLELLRS